MTRLGALAAARNSSVSLAHMSIANWKHGRLRLRHRTTRWVPVVVRFLSSGRKRRYAPAQWLSSHSYPYSNSNYR